MDVLEETMAEPGQPTIGSDTLNAAEATGDASAEAGTTGQEGELDETFVEGQQEDVMEATNDKLTDNVVENTPDVEMGDVSGEDTKNNLVDELLDLPASSLADGNDHGEIPEGTISTSMELEDGTVRTSESSLSEQFISQTDPLVVQNEPPQQLMEETDISGEGQSCEGVEGANEINDALSTAAAVEMDSSSNALPSFEEKQPEALPSDVDAAMLLQQGETNDNVDLGALQDELSLHLGTNEVEEEAGHQLDSNLMQDPDELSANDMHGTEDVSAIDTQGTEELPADDVHSGETPDSLPDTGKLPADSMPDMGGLSADSIPDMEELPADSMPDMEQVPANSMPDMGKLSADSMPDMGELPADSMPDMGELPADSMPDMGELPADSTPDIEQPPADSMPDMGDLPVDDTHGVDELPADDGHSAEQLLADVHGTDELPADDSKEPTSEALELPLGENESGNAAALGAENFAILAGGDHVEGSLSDLGGKILLGSDGSVHLLGGQEALQGMQLMEGDDKPEDEAEAALQGEAAQRELQNQLHAALLQRGAAQMELQDNFRAALLKEEEMKQEADEETKGPEADSSPEGQSNAESDALATLASAALDHQAPTNGIKNESDAPEVKKERDEPQWMDVGICKGTHCTVRTYYIPNEGQSWDKNWEGITTNTLPDHRAFAKLELEAGKAYKFRVAAVNSCGRGPWSEISAFRTCMPGVPGAPSAIKISKTVDGAHLSWEPPSTASGVIEDYTVYMAVRSATTDSSQVVSSGATQLAFVRIYQGPENQCSVNNDTLTEAHIDTTTKPAILFRIAARNEKGLGPAIQVRWLQDVGIQNAAKPAAGMPPKRPGAEIKPHTNIKRKCD